MLNEGLQWAAIVVFGLIALGSLRNATLSVPDIRRVDSGPKVGSRLPRALQTDIIDVLEGRTMNGLAIAFVTESCRACQRLIASSAGRKDLVVVARSPSRGFREELQRMRTPAISDDDGDLWRSLSVSATPLVLRIDGEGAVVSKGVTYDLSAVSA